MSRVNIVKRIKIGGRWKMFSIPRNAKGNYDWNASPTAATMSSGTWAALAVACADCYTASAAPYFRDADADRGLSKEHEIFDYSAADFELDRETLRELRMREARP